MTETYLVNGQEMVRPEDIDHIPIVTASEIAETPMDLSKMIEYLELEKVAFKRLRIIVMGYTRVKDWVNIDGTPYLQESGAQAIAGRMGVSFTEPTTSRVESEDSKGKYYTWSYKATAYIEPGSICYSIIKHRIGIEGLCSSRDKFFGVQGGELKPIEDIDERNVRFKAQSNLYANGIKKILGLRNIEWRELLEAGLDIVKVVQVEHRAYGKPTGKCSQAISEAIKEYNVKRSEREQQTYPLDTVELFAALKSRITSSVSENMLKAVWEGDKPLREKLPRILITRIIEEKDKQKASLGLPQKEAGKEATDGADQTH